MVKRLSVFFLFSCLVLVWYSLGQPKIRKAPPFPPNPNPATALTGIIRPNADTGTSQWTSTASSHYSEIDEIVTQPTTPTTTDNVNNGGSASNVDQYQMETLAIGTGTSLVVWVYVQDNKGGSSMSVDLFYDGIVQHQGAVTTGSKNTWSWQSATFSGLSLTQTQLDDLQILITGDAGGRTYTVAALYAEVTYSTGVSISLATDGAITFNTLALGSTKDTTSTGLNDPEIVSIDTGPANLQIRSTNFTEGGNVWYLGAGAGTTQVQWDFSKAEGIGWTSMSVADNLYGLDNNVGTGATLPVFFRLTMPSATNSYNQYSTTVTIQASAP